MDYDAPPGDGIVDAPADIGFDVVPDDAVDAMPDAPVDARPRVRPGARRSAKPVEPPRPAAPPAVTPVTAGPMVVCLACGESPPSGDECPHDDVATLTDAPGAAAAVVKRLQAAVAERLAQERALRRLVAAEVTAGRADVVTTRRRLEAPAPGAPLPPCPTCGHRAGASREGRKRSRVDAQGAFAFVEAPSAQRGDEPTHAGADDHAD